LKEQYKGTTIYKGYFSRKHVKSHQEK